MDKHSELSVLLSACWVLLALSADFFDESQEHDRDCMGVWLVACLLGWCLGCLVVRNLIDTDRSKGY